MALAAAVVAPSCAQPAVKCVSARGDFAAKYTLLESTGPCAARQGERIGLQTYNAARPDGMIDFSRASIAILPARLGDAEAHAKAVGLADPDATHAPYALGSFASAEPAEDGFCLVPTLSVAEQDLPALPAVPPDPTKPGDTGTPAAPAARVTYTWSGVLVYVTPNAIGTQLAGDLAIDDGDCHATYRVAAVYPAHGCADKDGNPDNRLCAPEADPATGSDVGSGLNPDFPVECDPSLLLCVLTEPPPALR
jgi:hypothetical protein